MAGERMGLYDLVAAARDRHLGRGQVRECLAASGYAEEAERVEKVVDEVAADALKAAWQGRYLRAYKITSPDWVSDSLALRDVLTAAPLEACPHWGAFVGACELAERIDSFLAAVARGKVAAALATDCRQDLGMLLVLADWCAEHDLPAAAAEARHLYGLTR
jgi:hypothetical protein